MSDLRRKEDEDRLAALGYKQELKRNWSVLHNFGISFSIISVITGLTTLFGYGLNTGGPAVMTIGWIVVCFFTMFVGLGMAEIVSAIPSSGGPYHWAGALAPPEKAALYAWITGWFNLLGQVAVTTGITFGLAGLISFTSQIGTDYVATPARTIGIYAVLLVSHGIVNTFGVGILRYLNNSSIALHSLGVGSFCIAVLAKAPTHQSAKFVFTHFQDRTGGQDNGVGGWSMRASPEYVALCGLLLSQYNKAITGFDASAHMSEETDNASWAAPIGVLTSIGVSAAFGFFVLISLLFSIQNVEATNSAGQPVVQILTDIFGDKGAIALMTLICVCVWHCGLFSMTSNSRMMFAFSRDGALPSFFHHVDKRFQSPIRTVWLAAVLSFCLALPSLGSSVAFAAATSIATIGLYISYALPILVALIYPRNFHRGPFNLRWASRPVGVIAVLWVCFMTVIFCLPTANPVTSQTLNYTPVAVGIVALWVFVSWFVWAKRSFKGPTRVVDLDAEDEATARMDGQLMGTDANQKNAGVTSDYKTVG